MFKRIILHLIFWALSFLIFAKATALGELGYVDWIYSAIWFCIFLPIFYLSFASVFLIDTQKEEKKKKHKGWKSFFYAPYMGYLLGMINILLQAANHQDGIFRLILRFNFIPNDVFIVPEQNNFIALSYILIFMSFGLLFSAGEYVLKQQKIKEELAKEKQLRLEAENRTILQQVNPHFLYNTLNAIYAQAIQGSENVKESLVTLSELMRYPVSLSSENKWVSFQTELAQIKRYVDLQKLRFTNRVMVLVKDKTEDEEFNVPPLLLMIPLENAFKHGYLTYASLVEIIFEKVGKELRFFVSNPINPEKNDSDVTKRQKSTGQGLVQLNEGLRLLYGKDFRIENKVNTTKNTYEFNLFIPLTPKKA